MVRAQVVAANVDVALLTASLNADLSLRRIERYLATAWESKADPVIVLTKADLCDDVDGLIAKVETIAFGVPVPRDLRGDGRGARGVARPSCARKDGGGARQFGRRQVDARQCARRPRR